MSCADWSYPEFKTRVLSRKYDVNTTSGFNNTGMDLWGKSHSVSYMIGPSARLTVGADPMVAWNSKRKIGYSHFTFDSSDWQDPTLTLVSSPEIFDVGTLFNPSSGGAHDTWSHHWFDPDRRELVLVYVNQYDLNQIWYGLLKWNTTGTSVWVEAQGLVETAGAMPAGGRTFDDIRRPLVHLGSDFRSVTVVDYYSYFDGSIERAEYKTLNLTVGGGNSEWSSAVDVTSLVGEGELDSRSWRVHGVDVMYTGFQPGFSGSDYVSMGRWQVTGGGVVFNIETLSPTLDANANPPVPGLRLQELHNGEEAIIINSGRGEATWPAWSSPTPEELGYLEAEVGLNGSFVNSAYSVFTKTDYPSTLLAPYSAEPSDYDAEIYPAGPIVFDFNEFNQSSTPCGLGVDLCFPTEVKFTNPSYEVVVETSLDLSAVQRHVYFQRPTPTSQRHLPTRLERAGVWWWSHYAPISSDFSIAIWGPPERPRYPGNPWLVGGVGLSGSPDWQT